MLEAKDQMATAPYGQGGPPSLLISPVLEVQAPTIRNLLHDETGIECTERAS